MIKKLRAQLTAMLIILAIAGACGDGCVTVWHCSETAQTCWSVCE